jgi:hypothetical protein
MKIKRRRVNRSARERGRLAVLTWAVRTSILFWRGPTMPDSASYRGVADGFGEAACTAKGVVGESASVAGNAALPEIFALSKFLAGQELVK